jgi:hypothetical protein
MPRLPSGLSEWDRPATNDEVHSWSFGLLKAIRQPATTSWQQQLDSLDDQRIFGPRRDMQCACGKYQGPKHRNMICDICGVKITSPDARRQRFGHIDLPVSIAHSLGENAESLSVVPILPAAFFGSNGGGWLAPLYEDLVRSSAANFVEGIQSEWERLVELLLPVLIVTHDWNLSEAGTIARGLALERRAVGIDDRCERCGYPLAGLSTIVCPNCGSSRSSGANPKQE